MLDDYRDVIAYIQAGYLGCWGEWNTSAEGAGPAYAPLLHNAADRKDIIDHILSAYAAANLSPAAELRRPVFAKEVFDRNPQANVGLHNDCFLTNESDMGTYSNFDDDNRANFVNSEAAEAWAKELTADKSFGGETCPVADQRSGQPGEFGHDQGVPVPAGGQRFPEPGPCPVGTGETLVGERLLRRHAQGEKGILLCGEVLVVGDTRAYPIRSPLAPVKELWWSWQKTVNVITSFFIVSNHII